MRTETGPDAPATVRLADYRPPAWIAERVELTFELQPSATRVRARIAFRRGPDASGPRPDLRLDGRALAFLAAEIDGRPVSEACRLDREGLTLAGEHLPGDAFVWDCLTEIDPAGNTALEGLYMSKGMYCTQCEAEGFRKITFFPDRPDVMATYRVRIEADRAAAPVLLSNGNPVEAGPLAHGRHYAVWEDPYPKPCYLFALVAGDLVHSADRFVTASGRAVELRIYVRPGDEGRTAYAMDALKRSMRWDERAYGLEYDLDLFMIVAVDDFNMGAMENKGLNVFNSKYVLASPETATDRDYELIEGIVAHEYFHNWTGNRITCRDWFQLCLKEGLTVFRDQCFSADERSAAVKRIDDVKALRARQFREDAGPLAHPVRPEEYVEINNFYTATVYEKGAEVIRMLRTLVGDAGYAKALRLYVERHDGQACTIEDFRRCFEDACGMDLSAFARWWSQSGTPRVRMGEAWDGDALTLTLAQSTPPTPGQPEKAPFVIPVAIGLIDPDGREIQGTTVLTLDQAEASFRFPGLARRPVVSALRGFSAPVILERDLDDRARVFLLAHDSDPFARWEAGRSFALDIADRLTRAAEEGAGGNALAALVPADWAAALGRLAGDGAQDPAFRALALDVPGEDEIARHIATRGRAVDPGAINAAARAMRSALAGGIGDLLARLVAEISVPGPYSPDAAAAGRRALALRALGLLALGGDARGWPMAEAAFDAADNMTISLGALTALAHAGAPGAASRLAAFHTRWKDDPLVSDKWLSVQATAPLPGTLERVAALTGAPDFDWKNPNKFRAAVGALAMANPSVFHRPDGEGYRFVADWLLRLDPVNPQTAARVAGAFETWSRLEPGRRALAESALRRVASVATLSRNTREMIERMLVG